MDYFNLKFHQTTLKNEIYAGISMFMAMGYILVVCPTLLSEIGMDYNGVFLATVLASGITTIISAFYTKLPIALAPGLSGIGLFIGLATGPDALAWPTLLLATYVSGIVLCVFVRFGIYDKIVEIMGISFRRMIMSGIGLALFLYGLSTIGLLNRKGNIYVFGKIDPIPLGICAISLAIICALNKNHRKSCVTVGLLVSCFLGICARYYEEYLVTGISVKEYLAVALMPSDKLGALKEVMLSFPFFEDVLSDGRSVVLFLNAVFIIMIGHFFDAIGTNTSSFDAIRNNIDIRVKGTLSLKRAIHVEGVAGIISGLLGVPSATTYAESLVGIVSGGRTGFTALTTGILFLACFLYAPLFKIIPTYVGAPALVYVGLSLTLRFREFNRKRKTLFAFGIALIIYTGVTFNIARAVLYGLLIYTLIKFFVEKTKPVSKWWIMLLFVAVHVLLTCIV